MTDYTAEVEARLKQQAYECHCTSPDDCCQDCSDIRAALGEIDKQSHLHDLDHKLANAMMERAEAAEAWLAEVTRIVRALEECARAERIRCRDEWAKSEAEVERLRDRLRETEEELEASRAIAEAALRGER